MGTKFTEPITIKRCRKAGIIGSLFLLLTILPYVFFITMLLQQQYLKLTVHQRLERSQLQLIQIAPEEARWIDYPKEVVINNRLFDVSEWKLENGMLFLKGLFDDAETEIEQELENAREQTAGKQNKGLENVFPLLHHCFFNNHSENAFKEKAGHRYHRLLNDNNTAQWYAKVPSPPPQPIAVI